jgi:hypothetical protein
MPTLNLVTKYGPLDISAQSAGVTCYRAWSTGPRTLSSVE